MRRLQAVSSFPRHVNPLFLVAVEPVEMCTTQVRCNGFRYIRNKFLRREVVQGLMQQAGYTMPTNLVTAITPVKRDLARTEKKAISYAAAFTGLALRWNHYVDHPFLQHVHLVVCLFTVRRTNVTKHHQK